MRILILGGGGMIGQKLARKLRGEGFQGAHDLNITLLDMAFPADGADGCMHITGSLTEGATIQKVVDLRPDIIFHLAAIVSGDAEAHFDKGWDINMMSMWQLLNGLKEAHEQSDGAYMPRIVFTSSIAVFGGPLPDKIHDDFLLSPQSSYGAQKACCEMLLSDFSRKGYVDGLSLRLPTICVRPGKPNLAASSFFSGIIREPLNGQKAYLPVADSTRHWHASPRSAIAFLVHAAGLDTKTLDGRRALNLPGVSCTVAEQIEALRAIAGQKAVDLIEMRPDETINRIVSGWPRNFAPERAIALGFEAERNFDEIIQVYIDDDMPQRS